MEALQPYSRFVKHSCPETTDILEGGESPRFWLPLSAIRLHNESPPVRLYQVANEADEGPHNRTTIDAQKGNIVVGSKIHARGFAPDGATFDEVEPQIIAALEEAEKNGVRDSYSFLQTVRRTVGR